MDPLSLLVGALKVTPVEILRAVWKAAYEETLKNKMTQAQRATLLGTNRRTLQRAIDSDFTSTRADTLANALGRMQQNSLMNPQKVGKNYSVFRTELATTEWLSQARTTAQQFGSPTSFKIDITTDEANYEGFKSFKSVNFSEFDTRIFSLMQAGFTVDRVSQITFRY